MRILKTGILNDEQILLKINQINKFKKKKKWTISWLYRLLIINYFERSPILLNGFSSPHV